MFLEDTTNFKEEDINISKSLIFGYNQQVLGAFTTYIAW